MSSTTTINQPSRALKKANEVRSAMSVIRRQVADGELSVAMALFDPRADSLTVDKLLTSQRRWGERRVRRLLRNAAIPERKRVGTLTTRQRAAIIDALEVTL